MSRWRLLCWGAVAIGLTVYIVTFVRIAQSAPAGWRSFEGIYINLSYLFSRNFEKWGQFGDFVGGTLNSIFLIASFYLLVSNYRHDRQEAKRADLIKQFDSLSLMLDQYIEQYISIKNFDGKVKDIISSRSSNAINNSSKKFRESVLECQEIKQYARASVMACNAYVGLLSVGYRYPSSVIVFKAHFEFYFQFLVNFGFLDGDLKSKVESGLRASECNSAQDIPYKINIYDSKLWKVYFCN